MNLDQSDMGEGSYDHSSCANVQLYTSLIQPYTDLNSVSTPTRRIALFKAQSTGAKRRSMVMLQENSFEGEADESPASKSKNRKTVGGQPRALTQTLSRYTNKHYERYDHKNPQTVKTVTGAFVNYGDYDEYVLFIDPYAIELSEIPTVGVRLLKERVRKCVGKGKDIRLALNPILVCSTHTSQRPRFHRYK